MEYVIPEDAFVDEEDGGTSALKLGIKQMRQSDSGIWRVDFNLVPWLGFEPGLKTLYGVPPIRRANNASLMGTDCKKVLLFLLFFHMRH